MKYITLLLVCFVLVTSSCSKSSGPLELNGVYTEVTPFAGAMQLNFVPGGLLVKSDSGVSSKDTFMYTINYRSIELTTFWSNLNPGSSFYFELLDAHSFKIGNLNASIPEAPPTYMTFRKQ